VVQELNKSGSEITQTRFAVPGAGFELSKYAKNNQRISNRYSFDIQYLAIVFDWM
jgi:hypothetical protein